MGNKYDKKKGGVQPFGGSYAGVERYEKKNGVVSFYIKYKNLQNITTRDKVGDSPEMTKTKALNLLNAKKTELKELRKMKQNDIPDFYIPKKKKRNSNFMTVNDIAAIYLKDKADTKDFTNIKSKYDNHIKDHPIASKPIVMIDQDDIKAFIKDKENTYVAKNRTQRKRKKRPTRDKSGIIEYIETDEEHKKRQYKLSNSTVNAIYGLIVTMTNYAIEDEIYTGKNPLWSKRRKVQWTKTNAVRPRTTKSPVAYAISKLLIMSVLPWRWMDEQMYKR